MTHEQEKTEFRVGPFTTGDLIALLGVVFMSGALWFQVNLMAAEQARMGSRISALEQVVPNEYVRRRDYREDVREMKERLRRIETKVDSKADKK